MNKNRKKNKRGKTKQRRIADKVGNYVGRCPGLAISVYVLLQRTTPSMLVLSPVEFNRRGASGHAYH
jgi:hypothetical protein